MRLVKVDDKSYSVDIQLYSGLSSNVNVNNIISKIRNRMLRKCKDTTYIKLDVN